MAVRRPALALFDEIPVLQFCQQFAQAFKLRVSELAGEPGFDSEARFYQRLCRSLPAIGESQENGSQYAFTERSSASVSALLQREINIAHRR